MFVMVFELNWKREMSPPPVGLDEDDNDNDDDDNDAHHDSVSSS